MYPAGPKHAWSPPPSDQRLALEIVPSAAGGKLHVRVLWQGQPVDAAEVKADRPGNDSIEGTTNAAGEFSIPIGRPGLYALRAKHIEKMAGTWEGKRYASVRHYGTLVVTIADDDSRAVQSDGAKRPKRLIARADMKHPKTVSTSATAPATAGRRLPDLPFGVTSFGAALVGQTLYVCEGHLGPAHEYAVLEQSDGFLRLNLRRAKEVGACRDRSPPSRFGDGFVRKQGVSHRRLRGTEPKGRDGRSALDARFQPLRSGDGTLGRFDSPACRPLLARSGRG